METVQTVWYAPLEVLVTAKVYVCARLSSWSWSVTSTLRLLQLLLQHAGSGYTRMLPSMPSNLMPPAW